MPKFIQDLEAVIAKLKPYLPEYLTEHGIDISKSFLCPSPEHDDHDPSAKLIQDKDNPRVFCFGCGRHMDLLDLVYIWEKKPRIGIEWVQDTIKYLAEKYKVEIQLADLTEEQAYELDTYRVYRTAASLIETPSLDENAKELQAYQAEVSRRGWNTKSMEAEGVGIVRDYLVFRTKLKEAGFAAAFLDEIDLGRRDIFNPNNMIFTWRDEHGRPIGFTARNLLYETQKEEADKAGKKCNTHKYNNQRTTGLKCNIFQKGKRLYGIDKAIKATPPLYIFEGQADAITARQHGLENCVALAGSSLSTEHVLLLKQLGCYDIVLCLDSDETGQTKQAQILEEKLAGHRELKVRLVVLPEGEDPDSFIRKEGLAAFKKLTLWSAFEWRINRYPEEAESTEICKQMIPFIVNEPSPVEREALCKTLSRRTGVTLKAISEELNILLNAREYERSRERQEAIERIQFSLSKHPEEAESILLEGTVTLSELSKRYDKDTLSAEASLRDLEEQKQFEENRSSDYEGFQLGPDLRPLQDALCGEWSKDVVLLWGGKPNAGKSAFLAKMMYNVIVYNENVTAIYLTIDDTKAKLLPRFVTIAEGSHELLINQVRNPNYWLSLGKEYPRCRGVLEKRNLGYQRVSALIKTGQLILKDMNDGASLPFIENLIKFHQDKNPERNVVFFFDNLHKSTDFHHMKDERSRYKAISEAVKNLAGRVHIPFISTVEYTKVAPGVKPTDHNIGETGQLVYDADFIAHVYSEVADIPDKFTVCHHDYNWRGEWVTLPRIELNVSKNKISDVKDILYFDFWPACSDYRCVDKETVARDAQSMKQQRQDSRRSEDVFGGSFDK